MIQAKNEDIWQGYAEVMVFWIIAGWSWSATDKMLRVEGTEAFR